jgi:beta-glucanase (GH16 family)
MNRRFFAAPLILALFAACSESAPDESEQNNPSSGGGSSESGTTGGSSAAGGDSSMGTGGEVNSTGGSTHGLTLIGDGSNQCEDCPQLGEPNEHGEILVFSDDFVAADLDRSIWTQEIGMVRNQEEQCYLDRAENIILSDGHLTLRAIHESVDDPVCFREWEEGQGEVQGAYSSAAITTIDNGAFKFGRFEARIRVPAATGSWPAFWMRPQERVYGSWPLSGEIDVMEHVSQEPNIVHGTVHFDFFGHTYDGGQLESSAPLDEEFHVYSVNWTEERIDWFFDGEAFHTFDLTEELQGRRPFHESFYLLLNLAVGGHWPEDPIPSEYPAEMQVDWVRVWQLPLN